MPPRRPSRSPSPQARQAAVAARGAGRLLDFGGTLVIVAIVAELGFGGWKAALPSRADIPAALGYTHATSGEAPGSGSAGGTRILFGSCNKLSCDAGREAAPAPGPLRMSVRLEQALSPEAVADSPFPSGQGCVRPEAAAAIWPAIIARAEGADAWIWAGDAIYADVRLDMSEGLRLTNDPNSSFTLFKDGNKPNPFIGATPARLTGLMQLLKDYPPYVKLRDTLPPGRIFGTFDDHDLGENDGGADYAHRAASQEVFLDFLDEPKGSARRSQAGVYASHRVGTGNASVLLLLLDVRYNRDPYSRGPDSDGDFLGAEQWRWLQKELAGAGSAATVVVSSLPVLADRMGLGEGWYTFPKQRTKLLKLLASSDRPGVALLSGDIHLAELSLLSCSPSEAKGSAQQRWGVWEMTSSGMTHAWGASGAYAFAPKWIRDMRRTLSWVFDLPHTVEIYDDLNFGEVLVDARGEWLTLSALDVSGKPVLSQAIPLLARDGGGAAPRWTEQELAAVKCGPWQGPRAVAQLQMKLWGVGVSMLLAGGLLVWSCCAGCRGLCAGRRRARTAVGGGEGRGSACCSASF